MQKPDKLDYARLFGFDTMSDQLSDGVDFQADSFEARLGAKVGAETLVALDAVANGVKLTDIMPFSALLSGLSPPDAVG